MLSEKFLNSLSNERCIIDGNECSLLEHKEGYTYYIHCLPLEGTSNPLVRKCSTTTWNEYSFNRVITNDVGNIPIWDGGMTEEKRVDDRKRGLGFWTY